MDVFFQFVPNEEFAKFQEKHDALKSNMMQAEFEFTSIKESLSTQLAEQKGQQEKLKECTDSVFKMSNVDIPAITTTLATFALAEELVQIREEMKRVKNIYLYSVLTWVELARSYNN